MSKLAASRLSLAAFALSFGLANAPAQAASTMTQAFLANVAANLAILDTSSAMARKQTESAGLKSFAVDETNETQRTAVVLAGATPSDYRFAASEEQPVMSGRSVAVAGMTGRIEPIPQASVLEAANARMPATDELASLRTLHGDAFDRLYFIVQLDALSQIESDYRTYIKQGDDPAVASMAREQLPVLMKRLEALTRV